jgi:hypothetical protein
MYRHFPVIKEMASLIYTAMIEIEKAESKVKPKGPNRYLEI